MPESFIQVNEGTGKKLHSIQRTIGANTVDEEQLGIGLPFLASYVVPGPAAGISTATAASHLLQIMAGANLNVYVTLIRLYQLAAATVAAIDAIELVRLTTAGTGGTAITPAPRDTTDAAAGAAGMTLPTLKGTEGTFVDRLTAQFTQTIATQAGGKEATLLAEFDLARIFGKPLRIAAGITNGIAVKNPTARAGATIIPIAYIIEANY